MSLLRSIHFFVIITFEKSNPASRNACPTLLEKCRMTRSDNRFVEACHHEYETERTHLAQSDPGRAHNYDLYRGQYLPWSEGRSYFRIIDSRSRNFYGDSQLRKRLVDPGKQYRPDRRVRGRHALSNHLCSPGTGDCRLVDRLSFLAIVSDLPERWRARCRVYNSATTRAGNQLRSSLSGRCRCRGSIESRIGYAR